MRSLQERCSNPDSTPVCSIQPAVHPVLQGSHSPPVEVLSVAGIASNQRGSGACAGSNASGELCDLGRREAPPLSRGVLTSWRLLGNSAEGGPQNCSLLKTPKSSRILANQFCVFLKDRKGRVKGVAPSRVSYQLCKDCRQAEQKGTRAPKR